MNDLLLYYAYLKFKFKIDFNALTNEMKLLYIRQLFLLYISNTNTSRKRSYNLL